MCKVKDVLIEKTEKELTWTNPVIILRNHDRSMPIGKGWIHEDDGRYYADLDPCIIDPTGLFPSIGFANKKIFTIGLCDGVNIDDGIKPIGLDNGSIKGL